VLSISFPIIPSGLSWVLSVSLRLRASLERDLKSKYNKFFLKDFSLKKDDKEEDYLFVSEETCQRIILGINQIGVYLTDKLKLVTKNSDLTGLLKV